MENNVIYVQFAKNDAREITNLQGTVVPFPVRSELELLEQISQGDLSGLGPKGCAFMERIKERLVYDPSPEFRAMVVSTAYKLDKLKPRP